MKNAILIISVIISLLILTSCSKTIDNDCATVSPPEQSIPVSIIDAEGNSLIGEDNVYKPSEITLTNGSQSVFLSFYEVDEKTYMGLYYVDMLSDTDYYLKLNADETDTVNLKLKTYNTECFNELKSVETFLYNNQEISPSGGNPFTIQK